MEAHTPLRTYGQPAADHTSDAEELAGLYAFGILDGAELGRFERHLAGCGRCAEVFDGDAAMVGAISLTVPDVEAAPDFKARLLARVAAELETGVFQAAHVTTVAGPARVERSARMVPLAARRRPAASLAWLLPLAAIMLAVIGGTILLSQQLAAAQVVATASLQNNSDRGRAEVLLRRSGEGVIQLTGFDDLGSGQVYQAWVIRPGQQPVATGATARGNGTLMLDGDVRGTKVAVTLEPGPGATAPSQAPFVIGDAPA